MVRLSSSMALRRTASGSTSALCLDVSEPLRREYFSFEPSRSSASSAIGPPAVASLDAFLENCGSKLLLFAFRAGSESPQLAALAMEKCARLFIGPCQSSFVMACSRGLERRSAAHLNHGRRPTLARPRREPAGLRHGCRGTWSTIARERGSMLLSCLFWNEGFNGSCTLRELRAEAEAECRNVACRSTAPPTLAFLLFHSNISTRPRGSHRVVAYHRQFVAQHLCRKTIAAARARVLRHEITYHR